MEPEQVDLVHVSFSDFDLDRSLCCLCLIHRHIYDANRRDIMLWSFPRNAQAFDSPVLRMPKVDGVPVCISGNSGWYGGPHRDDATA